MIVVILLPGTFEPSAVGLRRSLLAARFFFFETCTLPSFPFLFSLSSCRKVALPAVNPFLEPSTQ